MPDNSLEVLFEMTEKLVVSVTPAKKMALQLLARRRHISVSDIIRQALEVALPQIYEEYPEVYTQVVHEEAKKLQKEN